MKKALMGLLVLVLFLTACSAHANKSAVFYVDTGDKIKVTVDLKAGYDLTMEVPFEISKDDETILNGAFGQLEAYALYYQLVADDPNAELLAEGSKDGNSYFFYTVKNSTGSEYDYIIQIANSQTVVAMGSICSQAEAEAAFAAVSISLAE